MSSVICIAYSYGPSVKGKRAMSEILEMMNQAEFSDELKGDPVIGKLNPFVWGLCQLFGYHEAIRFLEAGMKEDKRKQETAK